MISFSTAFRRSSNSPRYLVPATSAARSSATMRLGFSTSGTSPATMRCARPSTTAVLPTPGSPISTGLFLVRRARICMTRRISTSRPITGSSLPRRASSVRSRAYCSSARNVDSGFCEVTRWLPRTDVSACRIASREAPWRASSCAGRIGFSRGDGQQDMLGGDVLVLEFLGFLEGLLQHLIGWLRSDIAARRRSPWAGAQVELESRRKALPAARPSG